VVDSLAPMDSRPLRIVHGLGARDADRPALHLNLDIGLPDARRFSDEHEVVALAEDVDRGVSAPAAQPCIQPIACPECIQRLLQARQRFEQTC